MLEISASNLSFAASLATIIIMFATIAKISMRIGALELKVDTMWAFAMRRALSETVTTGIGTINSPLEFTDKSYSMMAPLRLALLEIGPSLSKDDTKAILELDQKFGKQILQIVCIPSDLSYDACMLLALSIARGGGPGNHINIDL